MRVDVDIVIVSWNVSALLARCLDSILAQDGAGAPQGDRVPLGERWLRVHVVDNASADDTCEMVTRRYPWVHLLASEANLGFTGANNRAIPHATGNYVLLLNPDTEVAPDALVRMLAYMEERPDVGVVGPRLRYGDGRPQPSRRRFPTLAMALMESTPLEQWCPRNRWAARYRMEDRPDAVAQAVDWLTGACLLTRRAVWDQIGLLDDGFFMYSEELDWCRRAAEAGWGRVYLPDAVVTHHEGQSSGQVVARRHILFNASKVRYWAKHHGRLQAEFLRLFLLAGFCVQFLEEAAKWAIGHRRPLRYDRMRAYASVIRSGLRSPMAINEETP
jgi:N-acetylglucosaminyl-diphospho-decaprenol L-rhamnosyltransferase